MRLHNIFTTALFAFGFFAANAQNEKTIPLEEVIVTASQIEPQSVKKSIKNVQVITQAQLKSFGGTNLADVLNQYINITVIPSTEHGGASVSLFGLNANYFKILVDNVPLVSESGFGNNTDISQINLDDIEQIEIIEGAMGVSHGANAVTGILNIVTKKKTAHKWDIIYSMQEETVGKEYNWEDKGRHIKSFRANHAINERWNVSVGSNYNQFNGFFNENKGKNVLYGKRGYEFLPRKYMQFNGFLNYKSLKFNMFYKFERMSQDINYYGRDVKSGYNSTLGVYKFGEDRRAFYLRNFHSLNFHGKLEQFSYNVSTSYQTQSRENESFHYIITNKTETNNFRQKQEAMNVLFSTGTLSRNWEKIKIQLGYEVTENQGFALVSGANNTIKEVNARIANYDAFLNTETRLSDVFSVQIGGRYSYQNLFKNQYAYSAGFRYLFPFDLEWRGSVGQAYRTPTFSELFSNIMFEGHYFLGNEHLSPERSLSFETSLKKITIFDSKNKLSNNLIFSHNRIKDRIKDALVRYEGATPVYQQVNINTYNYFNISNNNQWEFHNFSFRAGASVLWVSQGINNGVFKNDERYLINITADAGVLYKIPTLNTSFSMHYKYRGKSQNWATASNGYYVYEREPYHLLDASVEKKFFDRKLEVSLGVRNLTNTTRIYGSSVSAGHSTSNSTLLFYGRSYFLKLNYNLHIN